MKHEKRQCKNTKTSNIQIQIRIKTILKLNKTKKHKTNHPKTRKNRNNNKQTIKQNT